MGSNSRRQLFDRLVHRVTELVQALPFQSSTEGKTDARAHLPKFVVISLIGHRVLEPCSAHDLPTKDGKETHPDHGEQNAGRSEYGLGWRDTRDLLGEVQSFDEYIQC